MHWDKDNPEAIMVLGSLVYSNLWQHYWTHHRPAVIPRQKIVSLTSHPALNK